MLAHSTWKDVSMLFRPPKQVTKLNIANYSSEFIYNEYNFNFFITRDNHTFLSLTDSEKQRFYGVRSNRENHHAHGWFPALW